SVAAVARCWQLSSVYVTLSSVYVTLEGRFGSSTANAISGLAKAWVRTSRALPPGFARTDIACGGEIVYFLHPIQRHSSSAVGIVLACGASASILPRRVTNNPWQRLPRALRSANLGPR